MVKIRPPYLLKSVDFLGVSVVLPWNCFMEGEGSWLGIRASVLFFGSNETGIDDIPMVGGKNASLGEMYQKLHQQGINIPNGFAITAYAYRYFLKYAGIEDEIKKILKDLDTHDLSNLMRKGREVRDIIRHSEFPPDLTQAIYQG